MTSSFTVDADSQQSALLQRCWSFPVLINVDKLRRPTTAE